MLRSCLLKLAAAVSASVIACAAQADSLLTAEIQHRLEAMGSLNADFSQIRKFDGQSMTLRSSGTISVERKKSVVWTQLKPFRQVITFHNDRTTLRMEDEPEQVLGDGNSTVFKSFSDVIRKIIEGDFASLEDNFQVSSEGSLSKGWSITLTPKTGLFVKALKTIYIRGKKTVDSVEIIEANADMTRIDFVNVRAN